MAALPDGAFGLPVPAGCCLPVGLLGACGPRTCLIRWGFQELDNKHGFWKQLVREGARRRCCQ